MPPQRGPRRNPCMKLVCACWSFFGRPKENRADMSKAKNSHGKMHNSGRVQYDPADDSEAEIIRLTNG